MPQLIFSPAEIQELTDWTPDAQRDLRHKGFLSNYGFQTEGGRWKYTTRDLVAFWTATHLRECGLPIHQVMATSWAEAYHVMNFIQDKIYDGPRYIAFLFTVTPMVDQMVMIGSEVVKVHSLSDLNTSKAFSKADVIDLKTIADAAPEKIRLYAKAEIEGV